MVEQLEQQGISQASPAQDQETAVLFQQHRRIGRIEGHAEGSQDAVEQGFSGNRQGRSLSLGCDQGRPQKGQHHRHHFPAGGQPPIFTRYISSRMAGMVYWSTVAVAALL